MPMYAKRFLTCVFVGALGALLFLAVAANPIEAQVETATISGTVTDSSGAALPGATIQAKNVGTDATQSTVADAVGRYRIPDLPIGNYQLQATTSGFQTVLHKGITLTVGANLVVDFSLPVGQISQTVNVEGEVSRVETQTATVSSLVTPTQMSQLPLNGRNFEQLLSLAPGVQAVTQSYITGGGGGGISSGFYGPGATYSVAGSRPVGQVFLLDNQDLQGYWEKGTGSNITGNSLGVDAIAEFQVLTNTYSAQFGGTGAAINAASRSGTNDLHGSAYEYLRNSALDARNFFDGTKIPPFRRNQFGGSVGGPIEKNKLFFFANYEGLRSTLGITGNQFVPDALSRTGSVPCNTVAGQAPPPPLGTGTCSPGDRISVPVSAAIAPYLNIYPDTGISCVPVSPPTIPPTFPAGCQTVSAGPFAGYPSGNALFTTIASQPESENYILGRVDYTLGANDFLFGRYISDTAYLKLPVPFSNLPLWPVVDHGGDQFFTLEEKHIISATAINEVRFSFSRTNERADQGFLSDPASDPLQFYNQVSTAPGYTPGQREDGNLIIVGGTSAVGPGATARFHLIENKLTGGDDFSWTRGAHSISVGASVTRVQDNIAVGREGGIFVFASLPGFLNASPVQFQGEANPSPTFDRTRYSRSIEFFPYIQDDWKIRKNLTINMGLRWDFETDPVCVGVPCNNLLNPLTSSTFTQVQHVLGKNPNGFNFDPRIGVAWDPFSDHKTSIRAGWGMFHEQLAARTYLNAYSENPPSNTVVVAGPPAVGLFPNPALAAITPPYGAVYGFDYRSTHSPYVMQYNLTVQRDVGLGMVASLGYVGSQGVHLYNQRNYNTPAVVGGPSTCISQSCTFTGPVPNPKFNGLDFAAPTSHSSYNGLVASLNRQISRNLQGQVSYTYSRSIDDGSASSGLEQSAFEINDVYNQRYDRGPSTFNVTHALRVNSVYTLPFRGNRLVSGWQVSEILSAATGFPINVLTGLTPQESNTGGLTGDRPNFVAGCNPYAVPQSTITRDRPLRLVPYINTNCYYLQPYGTLGNVGRDSLIGPGLLDLDFSIIKETKITEKLNAEFRAEFFNILNHTNFGQPAAALFAGSRGSPANNESGCALTPQVNCTAFVSGTAGVITTAATTSRQIQFALKLTF